MRTHEKQGDNDASWLRIDDSGVGGGKGGGDGGGLFWFLGTIFGIFWMILREKKDGLQTDGQTHRPTDRSTGTSSYSNAWTGLKITEGM